MTEYVYYDSSLKVLLLKESLSVPLLVPRSGDMHLRRISILQRFKRGKKGIRVPYSSERTQERLAKES
jgi:hypothetical protein